jgi:hypothetical protein
MIRTALIGAGSLALVAVGAMAIPSAAVAANTSHATAIITKQAGGASSGTLANFGDGTAYFVNVTGLTCPAASRDAVGFYVTPPLTSASDFTKTDASYVTPYINDVHGGNFINPDTGVPNTNIPAFRPSEDMVAPSGDTWNPPHGALSDFWKVTDSGLSEPLTPGDYSFVFSCGGAPTGTISGAPAIAWSTLHFNADGSWTDTTADPVIISNTTTSLTAAVDGTTPTTVNLKATVTAANGATPTGTVDFYDGSTKVNPSPVAVSGGAASYAATGVSGSTAGVSHTFTATFTDASGAFKTSTSAGQTVTVKTPKPATKVVLTSDAKGTEVNLSARVANADDTTATDAAGTVTFTSTDGTIVKSGVTVTNGIAKVSVTGLDAGSSYTFTAVYKGTSAENHADSPASASSTATVPAATVDGKVDGATGDLVPGATYTVTFPDGTFANNDTLSVTLHSAPVSLGTTTATATGGLSYKLTIPASTPAGAHQVVFASTTDPTAAAHAAAITVAAVSTGSTSAAANTPAKFLTDWVKNTSATPTGAMSLGSIGVNVAIALLSVLVAAGLALWTIRRHRQQRTARDQ